MAMSVEVVLEAGRTERNYWRDLWRYRELFQILAWRDFAVRYRQTFVGVAWAGLRPILTMIVLTVIFNRIAGLTSDGKAPYALMVMAGMLPWIFFSTGLADASNSLLSNTNLLTKVYFPRLILPISKTLSGLVDLAISFILLGFALAWYGVLPGWELVLLPGFVAIAMVTALATGLWLTALNVRYRDIGLIGPFIVQIWMYVSPIAYSTTLVPEPWRWMYSLNPLVGVVEGFRWALLGKAPPDVGPMLLSFLIVVLMLVLGLAYFRHSERNFADII